jgi:hypothetical protein
MLLPGALSSATRPLIQGARRLNPLILHGGFSFHAIDKKSSARVVSLGELFRRLPMSERKVLLLLLTCYVAVFAIVLFLGS